MQPQRSALRGRSQDALAGLGQLAISQSPRAKRAEKGLVVTRQGSAVPTPPKTPLPSTELAKNRIEWLTHEGEVSVLYEGEGLTYLSSLYPQGTGQLHWRADVDWAGAGVRPVSQQMHCSFRPRNGWKFGSCDGWGTLTLSLSIAAAPTEGDVYDGQVEGPGAPGPQIHMAIESGTVSTPAPMLRAHGKGKMRYANGDRYEGQWAHSRREGQGKHKARGGVHQGVYEGAWAKDMRNGAGRYIDGGGNVMMGRWENNVPREGTMEWSDGRTYDGWWSGKCEVIIDADEHGAVDVRCSNTASFGSVKDGLRCRCLEHKSDSHVLLNPYKPHGPGTMRWTDGGWYRGQWEQGLRHGKGVMRYGSAHSTWSDGDVFEGLWRLDQIGDGFEGTMTFADGGLYTGKWFQGLQHNGGVHTYPNGDVFEGNFRQGARRDGHGKMVYANGDVYVGQWVADRRHGEGKMDYASGDVYVGQWEAGMHLTGRRKYVGTGHVYDGEWLDDVPHGHGRMTYGSDWQEGNASMREGDVYEGPWVQGRHGEGEVFISYQNGDLYRGGHQQSLRHGRGRMEYARGNVFDGTWLRGTRRAGWARAAIPGVGVYEGDWKDEKPHGLGTLKFDDTGLYEGEWLQGLRHGQGTMSNGPWRSYSGGWLYDKFDGEGALTDLRSCSTYTGGFQEGLKHGKGREVYGFIDASFVGTWEKEKKRKGVFTFPDGTRWERWYDAEEKLEKEVLLGDKLTWKALTARALTQSRTLLAGNMEEISISETYATQEYVADDFGRPLKTPSMLPFLGKSPHQNMGRQPPVAITAARKSPTRKSPTPTRPMTNVDLPSFLNSQTARRLDKAIADAAQAARLSKPMEWDLDAVEEQHRKIEEALQRSKAAAEGGMMAHKEQLKSRQEEYQREQRRAREREQRLKEDREKLVGDVEARQSQRAAELGSAATLDTTAAEEDIDRSGVKTNARGSVEPHSGLPELWLIGGTEVDFNAIYEVGGQLDYLLQRAQRTIAEGRPIKAHPLNRRAREAQREFDHQLERDDEEHLAELVTARAGGRVRHFSLVVRCSFCGEYGNGKRGHRCPPSQATKIQAAMRGKLVRNRVKAAKAQETERLRAALGMIAPKPSTVDGALAEIAELEAKQRKWQEEEEKERAAAEAVRIDLGDCKKMQKRYHLHVVKLETDA